MGIEIITISLEPRQSKILESEVIVAVRDVIEMLAGDRLAIHRATSFHLKVINPFFAESGLVDPLTKRKVVGLPIGPMGRGGSSGLFGFDEFQLYQAKKLDNLNVILLGEINMRKSSLVKHFSWMAAAVGYSNLIIDIKGEYDGLVRSVEGSKKIGLGPNTKIFLNPLDTRIDLQTQFSLTESLILTAMRDTRGLLGVEERELLEEAIKDAHSHFGHSDNGIAAGVATMPMVVEKLLNPTQNMSDKLGDPIDYLKDTGRLMAKGARRLTQGALSGMVNKETSPGLLDEVPPILVLDCADLEEEELAIMVIIFNYFSSYMRFHRVLQDEAWKLSKYPAYVESVRQAFKLGRSRGIAHWLVVHHLQNLQRSSSMEAIKDLIADSDTRIIYKQDPIELEQTAMILELNEAERLLIPRQNPGHAIWKIGSEPNGIEVFHQLPEELRSMVETSHLLQARKETA